MINSSGPAGEGAGAGGPCSSSAGGRVAVRALASPQSIGGVPKEQQAQGAVSPTQVVALSAWDQSLLVGTGR